SMVSPPRRTSAKRLQRSARGALRTTRSCRKKSRRPLPTHSTRRLGRKRRKNDRFNSEFYTTQSRTPKVRNVGSNARLRHVVAGFAIPCRRCSMSECGKFKLTPDAKEPAAKGAKETCLGCLVFDDTLLFDIDKFAGYERLGTGTRCHKGAKQKGIDFACDGASAQVHRPWRTSAQASRPTRPAPALAMACGAGSRRCSKRTASASSRFA